MPARLSYPRICIALGFEDSRSLLRHAREEANDGGRFFEFRLDRLRDPSRGPELIRTFLEEYPSCLVLATCRHAAQHGGFSGSIEEQIDILRRSAQAGARAVDVEIETAEKAKTATAHLRDVVELIVSYHNFRSTPALDPILRRMQRIPASVYKVVTTARKPSDNLRILALGKSRTPVVIMAMEEPGVPSRVLAPKFGGLYTYAAPNDAAGTAPGQVSSHDMRSLYRLEKLSRSTRIYGVIGNPVGHTLSPVVHNRAFHARRIDSVYLPFLVEPKHLKDFFTVARQLPVAGFSVTIPHKQKVIRYLDRVDQLAQRIGAVNTVWKQAGRWRGANTDVDGVVGPLGKQLRLAKSSVLVAGSGGAARAAAFALADQGAEVFITGRTPAKVRSLARACGAQAVSVAEASAGHYDAVVHATPVGMHPHPDACFFEDRIPADVVFDMVYNPDETLLLKSAREQGCHTIHGNRMFLEQAVRQFEIWTGGSAPRAAMERAMLEALGAR